MLSDEIDHVEESEIVLKPIMLGYSIRVLGVHVGAVEAVPGRLEYIELEQGWEGKGVTRATLNAFIDLSRRKGYEEVSTNNPTHPAMRHILETEGFTELPRGDWTKRIDADENEF